MQAFHSAAAETANVWYWANAYKVSMALFALLEVGAIERLAGVRSTACILARDLGLSPHALDSLLNLLSTAGVLDYNEGGFALRPAAAALLPLLSLERLLSDKHIRRDSLVSVLRGGSGTDPMAEADAQELWTIYLAAMAVGARTLAPHLVRFGHLDSQLHLLDLGGADGALGLAIGRLRPGIVVTVVDRPQVERAFQDRITAAGEKDRFRFVANDLRHPDDFPPELWNADTVLLSNVLHLLSAEERQKLLQAVRDHMASGTRVLVYDQFLAPDRIIDATWFMVVDWLLCGYRFDSTEQAFAEELFELGFVTISCRRTPALPGAMVFAKVPG
jgi:hypothetical protein